MKRSSLLEHLLSTPFECSYHCGDGIEQEYDGSLQNLYDIAQKPSTSIREIALSGDDFLSVELRARSVNAVIILKFMTN